MLGVGDLAHSMQWVEVTASWRQLGSVGVYSVADSPWHARISRSHLNLRLDASGNHWPPETSYWRDRCPRTWSAYIEKPHAPF